jgi:hypothetical protein
VIAERQVTSFLALWARRCLTRAIHGHPPYTFHSSIGLRSFSSQYHEIWYFGESELGAVRIDDFKFRFIDQPGGWLGDKTKPDVPFITNLRLDPFERAGWAQDLTREGSLQYFDWFKYEFWRFVFVQQKVEELAMTAVEFPPMQRGASFNLDAVKAKIEAARSAMAK